MFLDKSIFEKSKLYFTRNTKSRDILDYLQCLNSDSNIVMLECVLRPSKSAVMDNELEYIRYENMYKGYVTNNPNYREEISPLTIGVGKINNMNLKIQLLPTFQSPNEKLLLPIVGTEIMVKMLEPLLMVDL